MAIKRVWIEEGCISCGLSEGTCPEVFHVTDRSRVRPGVDFSKHEKAIKDAARNCPVEVIKFEE
jgi:ferredoxin